MPPTFRADAGAVHRSRAVMRALLVLLALLATLPVATVDAQARTRESKRESTRRSERSHTRSSSDGPATARIDTTVALAARGEVELSLHQGVVVVGAWERSEVRIRATVEENGNLDFSATPSRVVLDMARTRGHAEARYEVTLPRDARLSISGTSVEVEVRGAKGGIDIENTSGDVTLADVGGTVTVTNMSGSLSIAGAGGDVRVQVQSGDIRLGDVEGRIEVDGVSGNIEIVGSRARELRVETTSGNVTYDGTVSGDGRYLIATHSGNVYLHLPTGTRARLDVESYNGEFESDFPVAMLTSGLRSGQQRFDLLVGADAGAGTGAGTSAGTGPTFRVTSYSGDIHLGRALSRGREASGSTPTPKEKP
jgi:hypothetical protein